MRLVALLCLLAGCAGSGGGGATPGRKACKPPAQPSVSFANNIQPIFTRSCAVAGCHVGPVPAGPGQDLSLGKAYASSVNVPSVEQPKLKRVKAGDPDASYIVRKIEGGPDISGVLMPNGCPGTPLNGAQCLSPDDIAAIRTWITECALNN